MSDQIEAVLGRVLSALAWRGTSMSGVGFAAYPDAKFKTPQGAAFAAAPLVCKLMRRGLVYRHSFRSDSGYGGYEIRLTRAGLDAVGAAK